MSNVFQKGFAAMASIVAVMAIGLIFTSSFLFATLRNTENIEHVKNSAQSYYASESGIEDAIYRIKTGKNIGTEEVLTVGSSVATTTITTVDQTKTITSEGGLFNNLRRVETKLVLDATQADFHYGVQIGAGGLVMKQNSIINGSIYSNGDITCTSSCSGTKILGDAWVAGGVSGVDQSSTIQDAHFFVGTTFGATVTSVDTGGTVGEYGSMKLGADGFARISYYDGSNRDLKFVRCTNADCTTKNIRLLDATGDQGYRYTSLDLGSDGFARISYYNNTNGDLKFARCTDADCTAPVITTVESTNDIGQFSSMALGSDGFARISYYSVSAGDLKFVQCSNADCTSKNITTIDSTNDVGKYTSLALGSDGFARISYINETSDDLKFVRCTDAGCTSSVITAIDTTTNINSNTSLTLGSDGFARISYYDAGSLNLNFVQCLDADCITKSIQQIDTGGSVGQYSSLALGSDGFARISYYDATNGDLKFVQCTNADCSTKNTSVPDSANAGQYTSLALGADGFARVSYFDVGNNDLKFIRCADAACSPYGVQTDAAQSFRPSLNNPLAQVSLYLKKVGAPPDATIRVVTTSSGVPGGAASQITSGTLNASSVTNNYGWIDVGFSSNPVLDNSTTYWIVLDATNDASNYWVWGYGSSNPYANGQAKYSPDWSAGSPTWTNVNNSANADFAFKVMLGGVVTKIDGLLVTGDAHANTIQSAQVCGNAYYTTIDGSSLTFLNSPGSPCSTPYTPGTAYPGSADPPVVPMSITQANIDSWEADAASGGIITGPYTPTNGSTIGPKKINGDLNLTGSGATYYIGGPIWVTGNIDISNNVRVVLSSGFGSASTVIIADDPASPGTNGKIVVSNNVDICGSAGYNSGAGACNPSNGSYIMILSTYNNLVSGKAIILDNNTDGAIFYATAGSIEVENNASAKQLTAYKLELENNATVTYESGLQNVSFSSGPSAGWKIQNWKEIP